MFLGVIGIDFEFGIDKVIDILNIEMVFIFFIFVIDFLMIVCNVILFL